MQVIWAKGQETRNQFYPTDVVKYHGRNRGALQINFMGIDLIYYFASILLQSIDYYLDKGKSTASQCLKQFSYPANCEPSQCSYSATWFRNNSDINFSLTAKMKPNSYTGIGWSAKGTMVITAPSSCHVLRLSHYFLLQENADMIIIKVNEKSEVEITDR